jgi:hypothetical protein
VDIGHVEGARDVACDIGQAAQVDVDRDRAPEQVGVETDVVYNRVRWRAERPGRGSGQRAKEISQGFAGHRCVPLHLGDDLVDTRRGSQSSKNRTKASETMQFIEFMAVSCRIMQSRAEADPDL